MSEQQYQPDATGQSVDGEEDPLTELARIVSGEEAQARQSEQHPAPPGLADDEFDLEAQLMAELGGEPAMAQPAPMQQPPAPAVPQQPMAGFAGQPAPVHEPPAAPAPSPTHAAAHQPVPEHSWPPQTAAAPPEQAVAPEQGAMHQHPQAGDAMDFGAAFSREVSALESQPPVPAEAPPEVSNDPAMGEFLDQQIDETVHQLQLQVADDAGMEEVFADAFAKELSQEIAPETVEEPQTAALQGGWPEGETRAANHDFATAVAGVSSDPDVVDDFTDSQMELAAQAVQFEAQLDQPQTQPEQRRSIWPAGVALLLALLGGGAAISYGYFGAPERASDEPIVVLADREPVKVEPEDPGGTVIANQDKASYDRLSGRAADENAQERLVSTTEEPIELPQRSTTAAQDTSQLPVKDEARLPRSSQPVDTQAPLPVMMPRKVKTVAVKPDGTIISANDAQVAALSQQAVTQSAAGATTAANSIDGAIATGEPGVPTPSPLPLQSTAVAFAAETPPAAAEQAPTAIASPAGDARPVTLARSEPTAEAPAPTSEPVAAPATVQPVPSGELYVMQISSQRSLDAAEATYENLKLRFASLLADKGKDIQQAEVEGKGTFYRVRVPVGSKEAAIDLCSRYQSAGGSCFVTR